jgi:hypothetical protein
MEKRAERLNLVEDINLPNWLILPDDEAIIRTISCRRDENVTLAYFPN